MPKIQIKPLFKFCKVKVLEQSVDLAKKILLIKMGPDKRHHPICHKCEKKVKEIHSYNQRTIRDLNLFEARTFITISCRTKRFPSCEDMVEKIEMVDLSQRVIRRQLNMSLGFFSL